MNHNIRELIDIPQIHGIQEKLKDIYAFSFSIIDKNGAVVVENKWQKNCIDFYKKNKVCKGLSCYGYGQDTIDLHENSIDKIFICPHGFMGKAFPLINAGVDYGTIIFSHFFLEEH